MNALTIGWIILTIPVFCVFGAAVAATIDGKGNASGAGLVAGILIVPPAWWGLYFIILAIGSCK